MGAQVKTIGGSGQQGKDISLDFIKTLQSLLHGQSGGMGAGNPAGGGAVDSTTGAAGIYGDILGQGAGNIGGALAQLLQRTQDRDVMKMKESFRASGGAQFGTPGAYAEGVYRGEAAPNITKAIGDLQLGASQDIMKLLSGVYDKETPDAETLVQPSKFSQIMKGIGSVISTGKSLFTPGLDPSGAMSSVASASASIPGIAQTILPV